VKINKYIYIYARVCGVYTWILTTLRLVYDKKVGRVVFENIGVFKMDIDHTLRQVRSSPARLSFRSIYYE
jgi:hypothetical protein